MDALIIDKERNTPTIVLDPGNGTFEISGRSFPENSKKFYQPVLEWFDQFAGVADTAANVSLSFEFYYISSSSIISILELIKRVNKLHENGASVSITWKYDEDDDDIRRIGEDYSKLTPVDFNFAIN